MSLTVYGLGTSQTKWTHFAPTNNTGDLSGIGDWAYNLSMPSPLPGVFYVELAPGGSLDYANCFAMMFFGEGGSAKVAQARFWGISAVPNGGSDNFIGTYLGTLDLTSGATSTNSGVFSGTATNFVNQISVGDDATNTPPGIRVVGDADDGGAAMLLFDSMGFSKIVLHLTCTNGAAKMSKVGFLWRVM